MPELFDTAKGKSLEQKQQEYINNMVNHFTTLTTNHIQNEVNKYNKAKGLQFGDIHSCQNYKDATGYTHQAFCAAIWDWNIQVWEYLRNDMQPVVLSGEAKFDTAWEGLVPTDDEFIATIINNVPFTFTY